MLLSCPSCSSRFRLGNIQADHVKCPVCYYVWKIEPSLGISDGFDKEETINLAYSEKNILTSNKLKSNKIKRLFKYVSSAICMLLVVLVFLYCGWYYKRHLYIKNHVQIRELRCSVLSKNLHIRCQIHNLGDKKISLHRGDIKVVHELSTKTSSMLLDLMIEPYSSSYFATNMEIEKETEELPKVSIKFR